jgi:ATP-dependent helicase HrpA
MNFIIKYPSNLPVSQNIEVIKDLIKNNQVIIISGETGSGKTTQLPKILLEMGYHNDRQIIGHTQPRRVAAKSIAHRLQYELANHDIVGYKIRFNDKTNPHNKIKVMTDGILLQELHQDKLLSQYSALIIDEAHERSLNIDFILGYLKNLIKIRSDLKIIITSATIENEKFSKFFNNAPLINIEGKTYPVDIIYQPIISTNEDDIDLNEAIYRAIDSCFSIEYGDVLVFLPGEREIKQCINYLKKTNLKRYNICPFYARQSEQEQSQIFKDDGGLKIIITTNIAETSLTIKGVSFVIDSGLVKVKRYNPRFKIEQLLVEKTSKASAKQRSGRAGRVKAGICIRLYTEDDFNSRQEFTDPEIYRTNLANVILKLLNLNIGEVENFDFIDKPLDRSFNDGYKLLYQLSAININNKITAIGKKMLLFPIDVKLARIIVDATTKNDLINYLLVIIAFLSIIDPRETPNEFLEKSRESHKKWSDKNSDFISIIKLWHWLQKLYQQKLSKKQLLKQLQINFLSPLRIHEWTELYIQLKEIILQQNSKLIIQNIDYKETDINDSFYSRLHTNLLLGYMHNIGQKDIIENFYIGANNKKFLIHPSSNIKPSKWLVATEIFQTSKLYSIINANILAQWLIPISTHLVKYNYTEPRWDEVKQDVVASKLIILFGITIGKENVKYSYINQEECHVIFIKEAIIENKINKKYSFMLHNQKIINEIDTLEQKYRTTLLYLEEDLYNFYSKKVPQAISNTIDFDLWFKDNNNKLNITVEDLLTNRYDQQVKLYPDYIINNNLKIKLNYIFSPNHNLDGITANIWLKNLNQINDNIFDWLVLGFIREKINFIFKKLPKDMRIKLIPLENSITEFLELYQNYNIQFNQALCDYINIKYNSHLNIKDILQIKLPNHLSMHYNIIDQTKKTLYQGNDIKQARVELKSKIGHILENIGHNIEINNIQKWIPELALLSQKIDTNLKNQINGYYSLSINKQGHINFKIIDNQADAIRYSKIGLIELSKYYLQQELKYYKTKQFTKLNQLLITLRDIYNKDDFLNDSINLTLRTAIHVNVLPKTEQDFLIIITSIKPNLIKLFTDSITLLITIAELYQQLIHKINGHPLEDAIMLELDDIIFQHFLNYISFDNLVNYPRYLNAIIIRLDKYQQNPQRDSILSAEIDSVYDKWYNLIEELDKKNRLISQDIYNFKYKICELRISLFAQEIKTHYKVSSKRLLNELNSLKSN